MRIAVILENRVQAGGGFQQEFSTACLLNKHKGQQDFVFYTTRKENIAALKNEGIYAKHLNTASVAHKVYARIFRHRTIYELLGKLKVPFESFLIKDKVDLVYFLSPSWLALSLKNLNYVITVWDLCHRDHPEFLELNLDGEFAIREDFARNAIPRAVAVLTSGESLKVDLVRRYGCDPEKIHVAKFLPSVLIKSGALTNVRQKYSLSNPYVFYPAQFWPHKNHVYILDGLKILRDKFNLTIDAVFCGSDKGNLQFVLNYAGKLGLKENVRYVGFVPNEEMASFYQQSVALVMPTYFGPTNIPPLEAFALGCPVCYSDLPQLRDQVGNAVFLMDLDNPESLAQHIMTILNDPQAVREKTNLGKQVISGWTDNDYYDVLKGVFDKYAQKLHCWKND
ncbi:MAG: glycosyltransferase family 4 protein [Candidatus Omnitrophica bacterium]|nr:glycosyltransferase family 4 protein [Candidatus Omnitrophota bacterium]